MTKKIFAMFLAVLMVVSMLPISAMAANCPAAHTINNCEYTQVSVVAPTCGNPGYTYYECNTCHTKFIGSPVPATEEHTFEPSEAIPATCGKEGWTAGLKCKDCDEHKDSTRIPPKYAEGTPCNYGAWTPATFDCTADITLTRTCNACGHVDEYEHEGVEHTWGDPEVKVAATATSNGVAVQKCTSEVKGVKCNAEREIVVYFEHNCSLALVAKVDETCTKDGMKAYKYCRICNVKYDAATDEKLTDAKIAALVIPAAHDFTTAPSCTNPNGVCANCDQKIFNIPHEMDREKGATVETKGFNGTDKVTCTYGGFKTTKCKNCSYVTTEALNALGHETITVTVPATCSAYGYTYTYCTRQGCDSVFAAPALEYKVEGLADPDMTAVKPHKPAAFYIGIDAGAGKSDLFFTGSIADGKLATSYDITKAAKVYVAMEHRVAPFNENYYLYILDSNAEENYIEIYKNDAGKISVRVTKELPKTVYTYDSANKYLKVTISGKNYALSLKNGSFIAAEIGSTGFAAAQLSKTGVKTATTQITACTGGTTYDVTNHKWNADPIVDELLTYPASCTKDGLKTYECSYANCIETKSVVVPAAHTWADVATTTVTINNVTEDAAKAAGCEDGWQYKICSVCDAAGKKVYDKVIDKGYGHKYGDVIVETPSHTATKVQDYQVCYYCADEKEVGEVKVWAHANTLWESLAAAKTEHTFATGAVGTTIVAPTCTTTGITQMVCTGCNRNVNIIVPNLHDPSNAKNIPADTQHPDGYYKAPECTKDGWYKTFECADRDCKVLIGNGAIGTKNDIAKLGHMMDANEDYEPADCDAPVWTLVVEECTRCDYEVKAFEKVNTSTADPAVADCENGTITLYYCYECDGYHAKNFSAKLAHVMVELDKNGTHDPADCGVANCTGANVKPSTCYSAGYKTSKCSVCGVTKHVAVATIEHVNEAGEKFTNRCDDTTADRHCVVCCQNAHTTTATSHKYPCSQNKDDDGKYLCSCMIPNSHEGTPVNVGSSCLENAYTLTVCKFCSKPTVKLSENAWNGHKPVAAANDANCNPIKYGNYKYVDFEWKSTGVAANGAFVDASETIVNAEFIEYVPATYAADGYWKGMCAICNEVVTQKLSKLEGIGIELKPTNTADNGKIATDGSLIKVDVVLDSLNTGVYGFNMTVKVPEGLVYVGAEKPSKVFNVTVTNPQSVIDNFIDDLNNYDPTSGNPEPEMEIVVLGQAVNTVGTNRQNVTINGETVVLSLYFRAFAGTDEILFAVDDAEAYDLEHFNEPGNGELYCSDASAKMKYVILGDTNADGIAHETDIMNAVTLLTGENEDGKTYDVCVDLDKDGVITAADLLMLNDLYVGNIHEEDVLINAIGEDELDFLVKNGVVTLDTFECDYRSCGYVSDEPFNYCPVCGRPQN